MPKKQDNEITPPKRGRNRVYTRVNQLKTPEQVIQRKGAPPEETLNELCDKLLDDVGLWEGIEFSGPLPAMSPEQPQYQRTCNAPAYQGSVNDQIVNAGESPNNMTGSTMRASDSPEQSRIKSKYRANARGNDKRAQDYRGDNIDYGVTHSEEIQSIANFID